MYISGSRSHEAFQDAWSLHENGHIESQVVEHQEISNTLSDFLQFKRNGYKRNSLPAYHETIDPNLPTFEEAVTASHRIEKERY